YSWTEEEWDDLWQDIIATMAPDGEPVHYMGYIVLQTNDNKSFDIIDGQQRLTTITLLLLAVLKNLQELIDKDIDALNNKIRLEQLRNSYIGYLDPVTLISQSKLTLNRNNDLYYQSYLAPLADKLPKRGLKASEHLLRKAFEWFKTAVSKQYSLPNGADLARFIDLFADKLFFTVITVTDELNAYKVFETLNARGVRLSSTDLLKNYLFSIVHREGAHENEMKTLENRWEQIIGKLGSENFPDFLRVHWNSRHTFVRQAELFKTIRNEIRDKGEAFQLLRHLEEDADIYIALFSEEDELWNETQRKFVAELRLFNVRQPYPLLLAAKRMLNDNEFTTILRACSIISFRYNAIGGLSANDQERVYNNVARQIAGQAFTDTREILREMRSIYVPDTPFRNAFAEKQLKTSIRRNKDLVRYILFQLEEHITGHDYDFHSEKYNIEHILPENPGDDWKHLSDAEVERSLYRLGNMTLLKSKINRSLGNQGFAEKKEAYQTSEFVITHRVPEENEDWNEKRIAERQRWMAKQAISIWRIEQLS
ncbi:MAG: DUF262 domain-containing protein, partial [Anaerolineales bacterium]|nr:DUF262 domain-containing protein [Anaerolineales bacterium]